MATLTVGGVDIPCAADGVMESERIPIGSVSRAYDGTMRSTVRARKITLKVRTNIIDGTKMAAIRSAILPGLALSITGDLGGWAALGTLGDVEYVWQGGAIKYRANITLEEV